MIIFLLFKFIFGYFIDYYKEIMRDVFCGVVFGKFLFKKFLRVCCYRGVGCCGLFIGVFGSGFFVRDIWFLLDKSLSVF